MNGFKVDQSGAIGFFGDIDVPNGIPAGEVLVETQVFDRVVEVDHDAEGDFGTGGAQRIVLEEVFRNGGAMVGEILVARHAVIVRV